MRVEIGPRDIEKGQGVAVRRDTGEKIFLPVAEAGAPVPRDPGRHPEVPFQKGAGVPHGAHFPGQRLRAAQEASGRPGGFIEAGLVRGRSLRSEGEGRNQGDHPPHSPRRDAGIGSTGRQHMHHLRKERSTLAIFGRAYSVPSPCGACRCAHQLRAAQRGTRRGSRPILVPADVHDF